MSGLNEQVVNLNDLLPPGSVALTSTFRCQLFNILEIMKVGCVFRSRRYDIGSAGAEPEKHGGEVKKK